MKQYVVNENILSAVIGYLSTRPYREVSALIEILNTSKELKHDALSCGDDGANQNNETEASFKDYHHGR